MEDKWWAIFCMVCILSFASCTGYLHYNNTQYKIAKLEYQQSDQE